MRGSGQTTLSERIDLMGRGIHSGAPAKVTISPADADTGVVFIRPGQEAASQIAVSPRAVRNTDFATVLGHGEVEVATVEHLLAALSGLGVDNAIVEVDGGEVPIFDGSAQAFVEAIDGAGVETQAAPRRYLKIVKPVRVDDGRAQGELLPYDGGLRVEIEIDFDHALIGRQRYAATLSPETFRRDLAPARTFGFMVDVARLWSAGYARGASLDNTICLSDDRVLNPTGLRFPDEFVRHKALDAVGDLALAGLPILGRYRSFCGGHKLNAAVVAALAADPSAAAVVEAPRRRQRGHAELGVPVAVPAYRADLS
ncbi:MAG TPA: UDP-3-O-acyl-N-acetylglucosamine deacetylase [Xanthobacteraceae bacterium]|nr:UDP-3-O-acyl-N-acetylglucosamine deacetylase [Xanthobacteraceae bacterium]